MRVGLRLLAVAVALALASSLAACGDASTDAAPSPIPTADARASASPTVAASLPMRTGEPAAPREFRPEAKLVNHGPKRQRLVALTFDADMTEGMLAQLRSGEVSDWINQEAIRELRRTDTAATIFLTGLWTQTYPKQVRAFARDPLFELANHAWDHRAFRSGCYGLPYVRTNAERRAQVQDAAAEIEEVSGEAPLWFRFPGGCHEGPDLRLVASLGEQAVGWDVVSGDAFGTDPQAVAQAVIDGVKPGSIVIMHLHGAPNAPTTGPALRTIIPELRDRGYRFVTLSELLLGTDRAAPDA